MKYFKQDLLARFASRDEAIALAAQEELEAQSEKYQKHLDRIRGKLPARFKELQERYYLHDSRVMTAWPPDYPAPYQMLPWNSLVNWGGDVKVLYSPFVLLTLELDTPPKELLVLNYRSARLTGWAPFELSGERTPYLEWEHDEIDLFEHKGEIEVKHDILFSNGFELQIVFSDFDFATLHPLAAQRKQLILPEGLVG